MPSCQQLNWCPWGRHKIRHPILDQFWHTSPCHTLSHISGPPKVRHTSRNPQNFQYSTCIYTYVFTGRFVLVRGVLVWGICSGGFWTFPLLPEYIRCSRKLNITFNYRFHMYEKIWKVWRHMLLDPLPLSQTVTFSRTPPPSSATYFMDGPRVNFLQSAILTMHRSLMSVVGLWSESP